MKIFCLDDTQSGWGRQLFLEAKSRKWDAVLFRVPTQVDGPGYAFFRIDQFEPKIEPAKNLARAVIAKPGIIPIQTRDEIENYEDKGRQARMYPEFMPETYYTTDGNCAMQFADKLGYPFVSKSRNGSSCSNVRIIPTKEEARDELEKVFGGGVGLHTRRGMQRDYIIWQKLLQHNAYIYRVVCVGRYRWMFREHNRPNSILASGSGNYDPITVLEGEALDAFNAANRFFIGADTRWCGVDMAKDHVTGEWKVLETTLAWGMYAPGSSPDCPVFDLNGEPHFDDYYGAHIWKILCDEIELGVFDRYVG